jgi:hypothetical protein
MGLHSSIYERNLTTREDTRAGHRGPLSCSSAKSRLLCGATVAQRCGLPEQSPSRFIGSVFLVPRWDEENLLHLVEKRV